MRAVIQRVSEASVTVDGRTTGAIGPGLLALVAVHEHDEESQMKWVADKTVKLRIFPDEQGKMNRSVLDIGGGLLLVSQFTLYGDVSKGTRPSFIESAGPEKAEAMYNRMVEYVRQTYGMDVQSGEFAAMMDIQLVNDGPVTLIIEK